MVFLKVMILILKYNFTVKIFMLVQESIMPIIDIVILGNIWDIEFIKNE